ncbi:hypothetical protein MRB53_020926 [Persea americana]|uniref:Uncharacterized protein n=1 Tax=Persea americana TaxID=3435 RepID=A0ACC2L2E1_PERAE|nr:hypothetical protein MRB53_020926 [Persea americana]
MKKGLLVIKVEAWIDSLIEVEFWERGWRDGAIEPCSVLTAEEEASAEEVTTAKEIATTASLNALSAIEATSVAKEAVVVLEVGAVMEAGAGVEARPKVERAVTDRAEAAFAGSQAAVELGEK